MTGTDAVADRGAPAPSADSLEPASGLDDPRLVQAMEEYAALLQGGQRPDRRLFLAKHAAIAGALERCLDGLEFVHTAGYDLSRSGRNGIWVGRTPIALRMAFEIAAAVGTVATSPMPTLPPSTWSNPPSSKTTSIGGMSPMPGMR